MTGKVSGVTYENRQQLLQFIASRKKEDLTVYLKRDRANMHDKYAVAVVIEIKDAGYAHIGYFPKEVSHGIAAVIDKGVQIKATLLQILGGYGYKETLGALINVAV